jgi:hypothetical protein
MSIRDWIRGLFASPTRIADGGDPEAAADLHEEFGAPDAGEADIKAIAEGGTGGAEGIVQSSLAAQEAAETAEEDLETEEDPPDLDP